MLPTSNPHPKHKDEFTVTVSEPCPVCQHLKADVTERQRRHYWLHPLGQSILRSCAACYAADAPPDAPVWSVIGDEV